MRGGVGSLADVPLPQEPPPPLVPPQTASPGEEDKMPPYDEQTQAFIDGEARPGRERTLPRPQAQGGTLSEPGVWASWRGW